MRMRTAHPLAFARDPAHLDTEPLPGLVEHVPNMDLQFDGDCAQANGVELPIVVINLPHRTDRCQVTSRRMSAVGLTKLIKAPAVDGARASTFSPAPKAKPPNPRRREC